MSHYKKRDRRRDGKHAIYYELIVILFLPQEKSIFQLNISSSFKGKGNFCYKKGRKVIEISFQKTNIAAIGYDLF